MTNTQDQVKAYIDFKLAQFCRISGFDYKQVDAKAKLSDIVKKNLKNWVGEAMASIA